MTIIIETALVIFVFLLVLIGLFLGWKNLRKNEDDKDDIFYYG